MQLYSTKNRHLRTSLKEAVMKGLPNDNGLFMPVDIPILPISFLNNLNEYSFQEIAFEISSSLFGNSIPKDKLKEIVENSITFPAPIVPLDENKYVLELFHGPSLAFKDFGARFMAQLMGYFNEKEDEDLIILVATSGDTGGAVASGFYETPGIKVVILYPSGKVSHLQEKQLTTLGKNVFALEIDGTFDDCQALVKKAFLDQDLNANLRLSSANSINIARLIPQSFYYFEAFKHLKDQNRNIVFSVPSGNFGNLTAGLLAKRMGLPTKQFIAATNINDVVPQYLTEGTYIPKPSTPTISNAMDVGDPSNFKRLLDLFTIDSKGEINSSTWNNMRKLISGFAFSDAETKLAIKEILDKYQYIIDPHGAVGYLALRQYQLKNKDSVGVILETAHPSKFIDVVTNVINQPIHIPQRLLILSEKEKRSIKMAPAFEKFKPFLLQHF